MVAVFRLFERLSFILLLLLSLKPPELLVLVPILVFVVLAVVIPVTFLVRLGSAIFSENARERIKERPVAHVVWFVVAALGFLSIIFHFVAVRVMTEQQQERIAEQAAGDSHK